MTRYTPDSANDNAPALNSLLAAVSAAGGGVVAVESGLCPVRSPILLRSGVHLRGERTRLFYGYRGVAGDLIPEPTAAFGAFPDVWWTPDSQPGGLHPLCDADGLILGKTPPVGVPAVLRWDDVTGWRVPPDGIVAFSCDFRYQGGTGTIASWGGLFLPGEPLTKLKLWVTGTGRIRLDARPDTPATHSAADGPTLTAGNWYDLRAQLNTITGEISLFVDGVEFARNSGSPHPFAPHWSDQLYFGTDAHEWGVNAINLLPAGRIKNASVRAGGVIWTTAALTDTDGPRMTYRARYSDSGPPSNDLLAREFLYCPWDTNPIQDWEVSGFDVQNHFASGLTATNAQKCKIRDVHFRGASVGLRFEQNVYDGYVQDVHVLSSRFGLLGVANGQQSFTFQDGVVSLAAGGWCGIVGNSWNNFVIDTFVKDLPAGAVGVHVGSYGRAAFARVSCYNEGGVSQFANVTNRGDASYTDCTITRPGATGPVLVNLHGPMPKVAGLPMVGSILNLADAPFTLGR